MIKIKHNVLQNISYTLLVAPFIIFVFGWLKLPIAVISVAVVFFLLYRAFKDNLENKKYTEIYVGNILLLCFVALFITVACGFGGIGYQATDWYLRNAIYRDLVIRPWPVYFPETNRAMVYYFGYWMIPALMCKPFVPFVDEYTIWQIANVSLFVFSYIYIFVLLLWTCILAAEKSHLKVLTSKILIIISLIFVFWGTLDILTIFVPYDPQSKGIMLAGTCAPTLNQTLQNVWSEPLFVEHSPFCTFNCNMNLFMNVYNQMMPSWLAAMIFLYDRKDFRRIGVVCCSIFFTSTFPMFGLAAMMIVELCTAIFKKEIQWKKLFTPDNFLSLYILAVTALFYSGGESNGLISFHLRYIPDGTKTLLQWLVPLFSGILLSFALYCILCINNKEPMLIALEIFCLAMQFFGIGSDDMNFRMRSVLPCQLYFMLSVIDLMINTEDKYLVKRRVMTVLLVITAVNPIIVLEKSAARILGSGTLRMENDPVYTVENFKSEAVSRFDPCSGLFFGKLSKLKYDDIDRAVIGHKDGIIGMATLSDEYLDEFFSSVQLDDALRNDIASTCSGGVINTFKFETGQVKLKSNGVTGEIIPEDFDIIWENYNKENSLNRFNAFNLSVKYSGSAFVPYFDVYATVDEADPLRESGISAKLMDSNGEIVAYPLSFCYTADIMFTDRVNTYILPYTFTPSRYKEMNIDCGQYYIQFCFFYREKETMGTVVIDIGEPYSVELSW